MLQLCYIENALFVHALATCVLYVFELTVADIYINVSNWFKLAIFVSLLYIVIPPPFIKILYITICVSYSSMYVLTQIVD